MSLAWQPTSASDKGFPPAARDAEVCVHCHEPVGAFVGDGDGAEYLGRRHVCADNHPWTDRERDAWRAQVRRRSPSIQFAPSTQRFAELFGSRSSR